MIYKYVNKEVYFKVGKEWVHECLLDFVLSFYKEEKSYGNT